MREATVSTPLFVSTLVVSMALLGGAASCKKEPPPAPPEARSCADACGEGMRFAATKCVIDWDAGICVPPEKLEELTNRYEDWTQCPVDPGTMPPTSELCAMFAVQAMMRPSAKTGIATTMSFRWVTPP